MPRLPQKTVSTAQRFIGQRSLSDKKIANLMRKQRMQISAGTVGKIRREMGIGSFRELSPNSRKMAERLIRAEKLSDSKITNWIKRSGLQATPLQIEKLREELGFSKQGSEADSEKKKEAVLGLIKSGLGNNEIVQEMARRRSRGKRGRMVSVSYISARRKELGGKSTAERRADAISRAIMSGARSRKSNAQVSMELARTGINASPSVVAKKRKEMGLGPPAKNRAPRKGAVQSRTTKPQAIAPNNMPRGWEVDGEKQNLLRSAREDRARMQRLLKSYTWRGMNVFSPSELRGRRIAKRIIRSDYEPRVKAVRTAREMGTLSRLGIELSHLDALVDCLLISNVSLKRTAKNFGKRITTAAETAGRTGEKDREAGLKRQRSSRLYKMEQMRPQILANVKALRKMLASSKVDSLSPKVLDMVDTIQAQRSEYSKLV